MLQKTVRCYVNIRVVIMYRKYLQSLAEADHLTSETEEISKVGGEITLVSSRNHEADMQVTTLSFPEQHTIVSEAHITAARAASADSVSSLREESLSHPSWTFDPGGKSCNAPKKHKPTRSLLNDIIVESEEVPEFRKPPIPHSETNGYNHFVYSKPKSAAKTQAQNSASSCRISPMRVWETDDELVERDELLMTRPIREAAGAPVQSLTYPTPKGWGVSNIFSINNNRQEIIQVLPAVSTSPKSTMYPNNLLENNSRNERRSSFQSTRISLMNSAVERTRPWTTSSSNNQITTKWMLPKFCCGLSRQLGQRR